MKPIELPESFALPVNLEISNEDLIIARVHCFFSFVLNGPPFFNNSNFFNKDIYTHMFYVFRFVDSLISPFSIYEPRYEKTGFLHIRK